MKVARIAVGGLMLEQKDRWAFSVEQGIIVGRRQDDDVGLLCLRHCERNTLPEPLTHERCLTAARLMLNVADGPVSDLKAQQSLCGPYGAATFITADDVSRIWYCNRPPGLIVGVYRCPTEFAGDALHALIQRQCAELVAKAIFDRPSWGGDDPLTRVLIDGLRGP